MARRKDHTPEQLKVLLHQAAEKIIDSNGLEGLTARALARSIGYAPGTIYNIYQDMDALVTAINYEALGKLQTFCLKHIKNLPADFNRIRKLAYAYVDFARENPRAWETLFAKRGKKVRPPKYYQQRLLELFQLIENTLKDSLRIPAEKVPAAARVLWASLHGITVLTLDGRLALADVDEPYELIEDLLDRYLAEYKRS